jgi:hypothetical protein
MKTWLKNPKHIRGMGRWFGWLAFIAICLTIFSGYGLTQFRAVNTITLGLFQKVTFQIGHEWAGIPVLILLIVHVSIALWWRARSAVRKDK